MFDSPVFKSAFYPEKLTKNRSKQYTSLLIDNQVEISMTSQGKSSENQIAELINPTITAATNWI